MPHFSRLTDIVTCSLTEILEVSEDPATTLREVIVEMEEGLASARRVASTSEQNRDRLKSEIADHTTQVQDWLDRAKSSLESGDEDGARESLTRKVEVEDLVEGLRPELDAAEANYQNMLRIQKALEARYAEATRRMARLQGPDESADEEPASHAVMQSRQEKTSEVEAELEALRQQLGG